MMDKDYILQATDVSAIAQTIPGATPGGIDVKVLNTDEIRGAPTTITILKPGATIPAHYHKNTSETHYVLEGDFINAGISYGPGAFFTHAAGTVHGPHSSMQGCSVLTVQPTHVDAGDFHIAD